MQRKGQVQNFEKTRGGGGSLIKKIKIEVSIIYILVFSANSYRPALWGGDTLNSLGYCLKLRQYPSEFRESNTDIFAILINDAKN